MNETNHSDWRVLLVGSNGTEHETINQLTNHGLSVMHADDAEKAVRFTSEHHFDVAIIHSDTPGLTEPGFVTLAYRLRIPLVIVTEPQPLAGQSTSLFSIRSRQVTQPTTEAFTGYHECAEPQVAPEITVEVLSAMASGLIHNLGNLLDAVDSFSLSTDEEELPFDSEPLLSSILDASDHASGLLSRILDLCRRGRK